MTEAILKVAELRKSFSGVAAVDGMSLEISANEIHAVIGVRNGASKTTLVSLLDASKCRMGESIRGRGSALPASPPCALAYGADRSFQITSPSPK